MPATTAEVKEALDQIASLMAKAEKIRQRGKADVLGARNILSTLPGSFAEELDTIDAYAPTGPFETLAKDEKSKLQAEFLAAKAAIEAELDALGVTYGP